MRHLRRSLSLFIVTILAFSPVAWGQGTAAGWQTDASLASKKSDILNLLKTNSYDSDRQGVEKFFDNYYFARWTQPANVGQVRNFSQELLIQDFKDLGGGARDYFLNKSFDQLRRMVADQTVTPTARFNAVYTIGMLNQKEAPNANTAPTPYPQSLPYLIKESGNAAAPDYIRYGALLGVLRHAIIGVTVPELRDTEIPALFTKIIQDGKPAAGRDSGTQELLDCSRLRAIEGLGALKGVGNNNEIIAILLGLIENSQESINVRCQAARAFGDLNFQGAVSSGAQINFQRIGTVLLNLTKSVCNSELLAIEDVRNKEKAKTGAPIAAAIPVATEMEPDYAASTSEVQQEITNAVQRIKAEFSSIAYGVRGTRLTGTSTVGIWPMLPPDDPVTVKLNATTRAIGQMFRFLDEGPKEKPAPAPVASALDGGSPSGGPLERPAPKKDDKALKVNLLLIRDALQEFGTTLDGIIAE